MKMKEMQSRVLSNPRFLLFVLALLALPLLLVVIFFLLEGRAFLADAIHLFIILATLYLIAILSIGFAWQNMRFFVQKAYALSPKEAARLVRDLILGQATLPPFDMVLLVSEGRVDPDGPDRLKKVGGPGYLSIRPDSAVVTCRGGHLYRVLGPGFHKLEPFERIWDAVDLRRQRRKVTVEAITRDGIPVSAEVETFFQVDDGGRQADELQHYPFDPQTILRLTTMKRARDGGEIQRWPELVAGKAKGALRNKLESMKLEELFALQHTDHTPLDTLSAEIEQLTREGIRNWGVKVEAVRVGPVQPVHESVSERWVQHWRVRWDRAIRRWNAEAKTKGWEKVEEARIHAEADLLLRTLEKWSEVLEESGETSQEVLAQLLQMRFMDVLRSMTDQDPFVQTAVLEQAETLREMLTSEQDDG